MGHRELQCMGPFQSESEANAASRAFDLFDPENRGSMSYRRLDETNRLVLDEAVRRAGIVLGEFDMRIIAWLVRREPATVNAIAGMLVRAAEQA